MKLFIGEGRRVKVDNNRYMDISFYPGRFLTKINMSLWEISNPIAKTTEERNYINFDRVFPRKLAEKITTYLLNKQSQKVAGFDLIVKVGE